MLNSCHRGLHGEMLRRHKHGDNHHDLSHLMYQHLSCTQGRTQPQGDLLLRRKSDSAEIVFDLLPIANRRVTIRKEGVHRCTLPREPFQRHSRSCSQTHTHTFDALRTLQHFYCSMSD